MLPSTRQESSECHAQTAIKNHDITLQYNFGDDSETTLMDQGQESPQDGEHATEISDNINASNGAKHNKEIDLTHCPDTTRYGRRVKAPQRYHDTAVVALGVRLGNEAATTPTTFLEAISAPDCRE